VRHVVGLQGYQAPGALFVRELIENGDIGRLLTVSVVAAGGPAGRRIPQANVYATDVAAGATVLSISTGHILATLARAVGEPRELSAVVALINTETTVIETGQTVPVTAPDQVVLAGRLEGGAVASVAVQGGSAPVTPRRAVPRVRPGDQRRSAGRAGLRHGRPVPPVARADPAGVGHRHPPGRRRLS